MSNSSGNRATNRERWEERVRQAERYPEGLAAYCRVNRISFYALKYWRRKVHAQPPALPIAEAQRSAFMPIQVIASEDEISCPVPRLPDSKWVADFILHLSAGVSRSRR